MPEFIDLNRGAQRRILLPMALCSEYFNWMEKLQRPKPGAIWRTLQMICELSRSALIRRSDLWRNEGVGPPPIYAIRKDQLRLYGFEMQGDIVITAWDAKKQNKPNSDVLARALRRARELMK